MENVIVLKTLTIIVVTMNRWMGKIILCHAIVQLGPVLILKNWTPIVDVYVPRIL